MRGEQSETHRRGKLSLPNSKRSQLLILGAGGHGRCVAEAAHSMGWEVIAFLDDKKYGTRFESVTGLPIIGGWNAYDKLKGCYECAVIAIGNNLVRQEWQTWLSEAGYSLLPIIHERATVSLHAKIGRGTTIMAGAVVSSGSQIGEGCIINTSATVDHDCEIGRFTHISPGAHVAGGAKIGECAWICMGANIANGIRIGANAIVATGAAVVRDVAPGALVAGVPAQVKRSTHFDTSALA